MSSSSVRFEDFLRQQLTDVRERIVEEYQKRKDLWADSEQGTPTAVSANAAESVGKPESDALPVPVTTISAPDVLQQQAEKSPTSSQDGTTSPDPPWQERELEPQPPCQDPPDLPGRRASEPPGIGASQAEATAAPSSTASDDAMALTLRTVESGTASSQPDFLPNQVTEGLDSPTSISTGAGRVRVALPGTLREESSNRWRPGAKPLALDNIAQSNEEQPAIVRLISPKLEASFSRSVSGGEPTQETCECGCTVSSAAAFCHKCGARLAPRDEPERKLSALRTPTNGTIAQRPSASSIIDIVNDRLLMERKKSSGTGPLSATSGGGGGRPARDPASSAMEAAEKMKEAKRRRAVASRSVSVTSIGSKISRSSATKRLLEGPLVEFPLKPYDTWMLEEESMSGKLKLFRSGTTRQSPRRLQDDSEHSQRVSWQGRNMALNFQRSFMGSTGSLRLGAPPSTSYFQQFVLDPTSPKRVWWDLLGIFLLSYDMIFIPLTVFDVQAATFFVIGQYVTLSFWILDVPASFLVGYPSSGVVEMNLGMIARRYLKTYFFMDVLLVSLDVATIILLNSGADGGARGADSGGLTRFFKSYRAVRIVRGLRLLRLWKLPMTFSHLQETLQSFFQSEAILSILAIAKLTISILALNHFVACMWYGICTFYDDEESWLNEPIFEGASVAYLYSTSLHWSLTQFTPASMEVYPKNATQRFFCVIVIIFALITFSSFVSSITTAMAKIGSLNSEQAKKMGVLQRYFRSNQIPVNLCVRVRRHLDHEVVRHQQCIQERDVELLHLLSEPLRIELHYEVHGPVLRMHNFFKLYDEQCGSVMRRVCHTAVDQQALSRGDTLFTRGERAEKMFFLKTGRLKYLDTKNKYHKIYEGQWISEPVMWMQWVHHGEVRSDTESVLVRLDATRFMRAACQNQATLGNPSQYAMLFVAHLNTMSAEEMTDLRVDAFDVEWATDIAFTDLETGEYSTQLPGDEPQSRPEDQWMPALPTGARAALHDIAEPTKSRDIADLHDFE